MNPILVARRGDLAKPNITTTTPEIIHNYMTNPVMQTTTTNWKVASPSGGSGALSRQAVTTTWGIAVGQALFSGTPTAVGGGFYINTLASAITPGIVYTGSAWVNPSRAQVMHCGVSPQTSTPSTISTLYGNATACPAGTWTRISVTFLAPATASQALLLIYPDSTGVLWQAGDTLQATALMLSETTVPTGYADGRSSGWSWAGTADASVSSGPVKP